MAFEKLNIHTKTLNRHCLMSQVLLSYPGTEIKVHVVSLLLQIIRLLSIMLNECKCTMMFDADVHVPWSLVPNAQYSVDLIAYIIHANSYHI